MHPTVKHPPAGFGVRSWGLFVLWDNTLNRLFYPGMSRVGAVSLRWEMGGGERARMYLETSTRFSHTPGTLLGDRKFSLMRGVQILLPQIKPEEQLHLLRSSQKCRTCF